MTIYDVIDQLMNQHKVEWNSESYLHTFTDVGIDSMLFIQLIIDLEDQLEFEFEDEDLDLMLYSTMEDLINKLKKYSQLSAWFE